MAAQAFHQLKKVPCNGCRQRKRKCTYEQPCARCAKSGKECIYSNIQSPKDIEYIQELNYINQVESIQYQISCMEKEMAVLKLVNETAQHRSGTQFQDYPSPVSISKPCPHEHKLPTDLIPSRPKQQLVCFSDFTTKEDREHFIKHLNERAQKIANSTIYFTRPDKTNKHGLQQTDQKPLSWEMTIKDGNFSFNTHILTYSQLHSSIPHMPTQGYRSRRHGSLPVPLDSMRMAQSSAMGVVISVMFWRKYTKTRYKSFTNHSPIMKLNEPNKQLTQVIPVEGLARITLQLVSTYFQCGHFKEFSFYVPGFVDEFMQTGDILQSPVVMALCSVICYNLCKHVLDILPKDALSEYGLYYFEQARVLIEDKFDVMDMETMITYTMMAIYKLKTHDYDGADKYITMGERIFKVLQPAISKDDVLFYRFERCIYYCRSMLELRVGMLDVNRPRLQPHKLLELLDCRDHIPIKEGPKDSEKEKQFIRMRKYIRQLRKVINDGGIHAFAPDYPTFISVFGHHMEMGMRHWYRTILPQEFQLSLPLFDDHVDDLKFFTVLEKECGESPVRLITLINLYNEYSVMAKAYIPQRLEQTQVKTEDLVRRFKELEYQTQPYEIMNQENERWLHWLRLVHKMRHFRQHKQEHFTEEELSVSDEDYFVQFIQALDPSNITFDMPIAHTSIKVALNMVRLSQFLVTRDYVCMFDARWILNAWEILIRSVRFKYQQPEDKGITLDRIRANLIVCIQIIKEFIEYSSRNDDTSLLDELQEEFNSSFT